jgi:hypothetical protein
MAMSEAELMAQLEGTAPASVLHGATILDTDASGKMVPIHEGTNGWTCMDSPGGSMCADAAAMEWVHAWQSKGPAPQKLGFIYMLRGDSGASNTDPHAKGETPNNHWVKTGAHVMLVGAEAKAMASAYPRSADPDPTKPYVMWPGTPYEHLMLPVK